MYIYIFTRARINVLTAQNGIERVLPRPSPESQRHVPGYYVVHEGDKLVEKANYVTSCVSLCIFTFGLEFDPFVIPGLE